MPSNIEVESVRKGVAIVTMKRAERRNALSIGMMKDLVDALQQLQQDGQTRVVILRGDGPVFCAGLDLAEASNPNLVVESAHGVALTLKALRYSPLVTIAAVHGGAYAGGAGVMAACDMAIGSSELKIAFPEARRGLLPALISDVLKTKVREGDLTELFLLGNTIDAHRAQQIGLIQRIIPEDQLLSEAQRMADDVLAGGPNTIIETKRLIHRAFEGPNYRDYSKLGLSNSDSQTTIKDHLKARQSPEALEGLTAFLEKRPPSWNRSQDK